MLHYRKHEHEYDHGFLTIHCRHYSFAIFTVPVAVVAHVVKLLLLLLRKMVRLAMLRETQAPMHYFYLPVLHLHWH